MFVIKSRNDSINFDRQNRIHPFYMVYISENGEVIADHHSPKELLDKLRYLCKGKSKPIMHACNVFNDETKDGRCMNGVSRMLTLAIKSIIEVKEESDIYSLFRPGGTTIDSSISTVLDDFELICFLVIKEGNTNEIF